MKVVSLKTLFIFLTPGITFQQNPDDSTITGTQSSFNVCN